jgi:hypothetical protein
MRERSAEARLTGPNQEWAMDFIIGKVQSLACRHQQTNLLQTHFSASRTLIVNS